MMWYNNITSCSSKIHPNETKTEVGKKNGKN